MRTRDAEHAHEGAPAGPLPGPALELPPGATFEPNPQGRPLPATVKGKHAP
jgi:hypothetical protein